MYKPFLFLSRQKPDLKLYLQALRTIYQGAKGETAKELAPFVTMVAMENNNLLQIADAVWIQPILPVKKDYLQWCKEQQREIYNESITATKVNDWASRHTQGKINKVLEDPVGKDLMMLIANAVYFKAEWETPFEERGTHNETFYAADGTQMQVKMMYSIVMIVTIAQTQTMQYQI